MFTTPTFPNYWLYCSSSSAIFHCFLWRNNGSHKWRCNIAQKNTDLSNEGLNK